VRVMQNSVGNNDVSSLSPDHANGVDPIIAERIEVLRGPSTLLYGSGAIGGVVNVIDNVFLKKSLTSCLAERVSNAMILQPLNLQALLSLKVEGQICLSC